MDRLMLTLAHNPWTGSFLNSGRTAATPKTAPKDSQNPPSYRYRGLQRSTMHAAAASAVAVS